LAKYHGRFASPAAQQAYVGERPFWRLMVNPMLTYDMRAFHLHGAQLHIGTAPTWVSWGLAGPSAVGISNLYLFKSFAEGRVETKFGYVSNDFEFLALQVGGVHADGGRLTREELGFVQRQAEVVSRGMEVGVGAAGDAPSPSQGRHLLLLDATLPH